MQTETTDPDTMLDAQEVGALLGVTQGTVYTMLKRGELAGYRIRGLWRIRRRDVDAYLDAAYTGGRHTGPVRQKGNPILIPAPKAD